MHENTNLDDLLDKVNKDIIIGNYQNALKFIEEIKKKSIKNELRYLEILKREVELLYEHGWVKTFEVRAKEFFKYMEKSRDFYSLEFLIIYYYFVDVLIQTGRSLDALKTVEEWKNNPKYKPFWEKLEFKTIYYLSLATIYNYLEISLAEKFVKKSLELSKTFNNKILYSISCYRLGRIFAHKGAIDKALSQLTISLKYGEQLGNKLLVANSMISIGEIYRLEGEFAKALQYYNDALIIYQIQKNKLGISNVYNNIGIVYYSINEYDSAIAYFSKSIEYAKEVDFTYIIAESSYYLIRINLFSNDYNKAKSYLNSFKKQLAPNNPFFKFYLLLSEAVILREENRFQSLSLAQEKLKNILANNKLYHEINIHAMLNLFDLFLYELRLTNNEKILQDLEELIDQLLIISKTTLSRSLLAEIYWLKGKLALLESKVDEALEFLSKAEQIAEQQQLLNLAERIKAEHRTLINELSKWRQLLQEDSTLAERIAQTEVDELVLGMIKRVTYELEETQADEPILILIVSDTGIPIYTYSFKGSKLLKNDALLSGFLSAMNSVFSEFFQTKGTIKKIEHQEYLLLFQNISSIGVCYVYTGGTFSAKKKLNELSKIIENRFITDFKQFINIGRVLEQEKLMELETVVKKIFQNEGVHKSFN